MNAKTDPAVWEAHFRDFKNDLTEALLDGPLEHVENLETIIEDALIRSGMPGVFRLLLEYQDDLNDQKQQTERWVSKASAGAPSGTSCSKCGEREANKLLIPEVSCQKCFLETFQRYTGK